MGQSKKNAKGRLDKYYHLAKDQGYRARSAFKLIQLNKKYSFLENSKCVIDLCAAPGGWLQVCQKYMPKPSLIIGVDLEKIKPIPGVITHVEDITTQSCRTTLRRDMKTWKADVVLHDGAPNVGVSWAQDAFTQSELTLSACKLACEFLMAGGTFVTKVFRSKDYNKLIWVFNQLFGKVEATKPASSRNVSAEIFVVCREFKAPKKIDPRLLDAKYAFKEMDDIQVDEELDVKKMKQQQGAILNDLMHPEKRKRHRDGYEDGNYTLHKSNLVTEFITSQDFLGILARSSQLVFDSSAEAVKIKGFNCTTDDIMAFLDDLKVLGKKDFKELIRWRDHVRLQLGLVQKQQPVQTPVENDQVVEEEEDLDTIIEREKQAQEHKLKKLKKKQRERKAKVLMKMQMGMDTPMDIGIENQNDDFEKADFDMGEGSEDEEQAPVRSTQSVVSSASEDEMQVENQDDHESEFSDYDSDKELYEKISRLDEEVDQMYKLYEEQRIERNPSSKVKKEKESSKAFEEWYGLETEKSMKQVASKFNDSASDSSDSSDDDEIESDKEPLSKKAKLFFDNPVFEDLQDDFDDDLEKSLFKDELTIKHKKGKKEQKSLDPEEDKGFQIVPVQDIAVQDDEESDLDDSLKIDSAQKYTMAQKMLTKSGKRDVIDNAYNRYAFNDPEGLPLWFTKDENQHNKPTLPITKEAAEIIRQKMRALDARPIKKVAEAKYRKQLRAQRRLQKAAKKSEGLVDQEDISERSKLEAAAKVMSKAKKSVKTEREKVKVVVAKNSHRGIQGRPKGVKGRYKMVDGRMKKETRAVKRSSQKQKKRR